MFNFSDNFFKKIENKTNVSKETIMSLAQKLQQNDLKNESTIKDIIKELSNVTGKSLSPEKEQKIIDAVVNDKVPKDLDKFI